MGEVRSEKSPRQNEFDRVSFSQPPRGRSAQESVAEPPINALIPDVLGEQARQTEEAKATTTSKPKSSPTPKPSQKPEEQEPPKGKITVMLPVDAIERLRNVAYWERKTLAALTEEGVLQVLAKRERENGGRFEERDGKLQTGRPPRGKAARKS